MPKHLHEMRTVLLIVAGLVVGVAAVLVIRATADDGNGSREKAIRGVERQTTGAYDCMPSDVRRRFDVALKRFDARFGAVIDRLPDDTDPKEADRALRADPQVRRLRQRPEASSSTTCRAATGSTPRATSGQPSGTTARLPAGNSSR